MTEVTITYCVPCRYQHKAIEDADAILREFGQGLTGLRLIPGDHGVYDVAVDGKTVYSLDREHHFPETKDLLEQIRPQVRGVAGPRHA